MNLLPFRIETLAPYKALLFDFDGTIVDSMPAHNQAWLKALAAQGVTLDLQELNDLAGVPNLQTAEIFIQRYKLETSAKDLASAKESQFEKSLPSLQEITPVTEIIRNHSQNKRMAIVSGSPRHRIEEGLNYFKLHPYFLTLISSDDAIPGKPHPAPFLLASQKLGVAPEHCLVFEDGLAGIESARAAQMTVVHIRNGGLFLAEPN